MLGCLPITRLFFEPNPFENAYSGSLYFDQNLSIVMVSTLGDRILEFFRDLAIVGCARPDPRVFSCSKAGCARSSCLLVFHGWAGQIPEFSHVLGVGMPDPRVFSYFRAGQAPSPRIGQNKSNHLPRFRARCHRCHQPPRLNLSPAPLHYGGGAYRRRRVMTGQPSSRKNSTLKLMEKL